MTRSNVPFMQHNFLSVAGILFNQRRLEELKTSGAQLFERLACVGIMGDLSEGPCDNPRTLYYIFVEGFKGNTEIFNAVGGDPLVFFFTDLQSDEKVISAE